MSTAVVEVEIEKRMEDILVESKKTSIFITQGAERQLHSDWHQKIQQAAYVRWKQRKFVKAKSFDIKVVFVR